MKPKSRKNDLIVVRNSAELSIEDVLNKIEVTLNPSSAFVWERCDGVREIEDIAVEMESAVGHPVSCNAISFVVNNLAQKNLLEKN
ncbi:MAG: PqqD family protein [Pyrinomonadaceae bacterium]